MTKTKERIQHRRRLPIVGSADRARKSARPTPEDPLFISASELRDFLRCRVKWFWRHSQRIRPKKKPVPLAMGSLGHEIQQAFYSIQKQEKRTYKAMKKIVDRLTKNVDPNVLPIEDVELLRAMSLGYVAWADVRDRDIKLTNPITEQWFDLPLTPDGSIRVRGAIDVVFEPRYLKKTVGCFENKFKGQIRVDIVDMNLQLSVYLWALRQLYPEKKNYVAWYQVHRKQMPGPRVKADLFARESVTRSDEEIDQWAIDAQRTALDMLDAAIYPNPMDACSFDCDYQVPCLLRGTEDLEDVLTNDYVREERR